MRGGGRGREVVGEREGGESGGRVLGEGMDHGGAFGEMRRQMVEKLETYSKLFLDVNSGWV